MIFDSGHGIFCMSHVLNSGCIVIAGKHILSDCLVLSSDIL